jgi:hypothetical protein
LSCCTGKLPGIEAFKNQGFTERGEITLSWYSHDKSKNYLFDAAVDGKDKDNERIPLQVNHASPANGMLLARPAMALAAMSTTVLSALKLVSPCPTDLAKLPRPLAT